MQPFELWFVPMKGQKIVKQDDGTILYAEIDGVPEPEYEGTGEAEWAAYSFDMNKVRFGTTEADNREPEPEVTEDAEFEIIEPKRIEDAQP